MLELMISDMTCGHCESAIRRTVEDLDPVAGIQVDLKTKRVRIDTKLADARVIEAIEAVGFTPEPVATA